MNRTHNTLYALAIGLVVALPAFPVQADVERIDLPNGDIYVGDVVDGSRTGRGVYTWADGHRYEGDFVNNRMQGEGSYYWPDGRTYNGSFVADRREGKGVLRSQNVDVYTGYFARNEMHG